MAGYNRQASEDHSFIHGSWSHKVCSWLYVWPVQAQVQEFKGRLIGWYWERCAPGFSRWCADSPTLWWWDGQCYCPMFGWNSHLSLFFSESSHKSSHQVRASYTVRNLPLRYQKVFAMKGKCTSSMRFGNLWQKDIEIWYALIQQCRTRFRLMKITM